MLVEVHGKSGRVHDQAWKNQTLSALNRTFSTTWRVPLAAADGPYVVKVGVFRSGWSVLAHWNDNAASISIAAPTTTTATTTATTTTSTTTSTTVAPTGGATHSANGIATRALPGAQTVTAGRAASITAEVTSAAARTALVAIQIYDPAGRQVHQMSWDRQLLPAGAPAAFITSWATPAGATGAYVLKIGVFAPGWTRLDHWNDRAGTVSFGTVATTIPASTTTTAMIPATTTTTIPATTTTTIPATTTTTTPAPGGSRRFTTVGHHIVDPNGNKFIPIGANVTSEPYPAPPTWSWWSTNQKYATGKSDEALASGWNMVRVSVSTGGDSTLQQNFDGVFRLIDEYTAKGIVVTASLWDFMGKDPTWEQVLANPNVLALQDQLVARYKDNPYVWLNPLNESSTWSYGTSWAKVGTELYNRARSQGWTGVFVWDLPSYGQYIEAAATTSMGTDFLSGKYSTVLSWHNYGAGDDAKQDLWARQTIAKGIPVMIGEFGQHWDPNNHTNPMDAGERRGTNWTLTRAYTYGFGAVAWHGAAATYNQFAFRMGTGSAWYDYPGAPPLSEMGARLLELGRNRPAAVKIV